MDARKGQVRELLRAARARIDPTEVGLGHANRRKSPGLRREDVAVLAGVSLKWYTWLEQGRDLNFSEDLLCRISRVLRLTNCEQAYLIALTRRRPSPYVTSAGVPSEWLLRMVRFSPVPALAMTLRWDIVAWNDLTTAVFRDYGAVPADRRNLLRIFFTDERYQRDAATYDQVARKLVAEFRVDFGRCAGDPAFERLIADLGDAAPGFERYWQNVELWDSPRSTLIQHADHGELYFDRISYVPEHHPSTRVLMFVPAEPHTARVIASLQPPLADARVSWSPSVIQDAYLLRHSSPH